MADDLSFRLFAVYNCSEKIQTYLFSLHNMHLNFEFTTQGSHGGSMVISFCRSVTVSEGHLLAYLWSYLATVRIDCWARWAREPIQQYLAYVFILSLFLEE